MQKNISELTEIAKQIRKETFTAIVNAQSGHLGGSLSTIEILTVLYFHVLDLNDYQEDRDFFILSKGHAAPALYATLAQKKLFRKEWLSTLRQLDSPLQGHPDRNKLPGIEASSGSLGQGLSVGVGIALGQKRLKHHHSTFVLVGDGELNEGQNWEAAMAAAHLGLNNLIAIVDRNGLQLDGPTERIMSLGDLKAKWEAFGWSAQEVDGHDIQQLVNCLSQMVQHGARPKVLIANTIKGKGVCHIENKPEFHAMIPDPDQCRIAIEELT